MTPILSEVMDWQYATRFSGWLAGSEMMLWRTPSYSSVRCWVDAVASSWLSFEVTALDAICLWSAVIHRDDHGERRTLSVELWKMLSGCMAEEVDGVAV